MVFVLRSQQLLMQAKTHKYLYESEASRALIFTFRSFPFLFAISLFSISRLYKPNTPHFTSSPSLSFFADRLNSARAKADRLWQNLTALVLGPGHHVGLRL